jgi:hypothetical protein
MDLNRHALEGIQLAGDPVKTSDPLFQEITKTLFQQLLQQQQQDVQQEEDILASIAERDQAAFKSAYYGLSTLIVESARSNSEETLVSSLLEECRWTSDRVEEFLRLLKVHLHDLQTILGRLDSTYPHIVDVDWRLDTHIKNNCVERLNRSEYLVSLKTQEPGKQGKVEFACTIEQLQDLVSKLKDATKSVEKFASK